jgi:hypothetical protein
VRPFSAVVGVAIAATSGLLREPEPVRFSFVAAQAAETAFPIAFMCRMLRVSRQGFYQWRDRPPSQHPLDDAALTEQISKIHAGHGGRVGVRRVLDELRRAGVVCSHKRVHRLMRAAGLRGVHPRPYKRTTLPDRRQLGEQYYQAEALLNIADAQAGAGDTDSARQAMRSALDILDKIDHPDAERIRAKLGG